MAAESIYLDRLYVNAYHKRMPTYPDVVSLDEEAVRASVALVARAGTADLARPTPCADWTLHGLITHMAAQHYGFAAPAGGERDPARCGPGPLGGGAPGGY